jgi:hypothetical protein
MSNIIRVSVSMISDNGRSKGKRCVKSQLVFLSSFRTEEHKDFALRLEAGEYMEVRHRPGFRARGV